MGNFELTSRNVAPLAFWRQLKARELHVLYVLLATSLCSFTLTLFDTSLQRNITVPLINVVMVLSLWICCFRSESNCLLRNPTTPPYHVTNCCFSTKIVIASETFMQCCAFIYVIFNNVYSVLLPMAIMLRLYDLLVLTFFFISMSLMCDCHVFINKRIYNAFKLYSKPRPTSEVYK